MELLIMKRFIALLCIFVSTMGWAGTVSGNLQTANTSAVVGATISFTLNMPAVVSGTAAVVPQAVNCYTSTAGAIVGEPDPTALPVMTTNTVSGTLPSATYFAKIVIQDASGVSLASPEASVFLSAQGTVTVNAPAVQPALATGYQVFISTSSGTETLQGTVTGMPGSWANYSQAVPLAAGSALPSSNTTSCKIRFQDEMIPTTTYYTVSVSNSDGNRIAGYPQQYVRFYGGSAGNDNVNTGWPTSTAGVVLPSPIVSSPNSNALQVINGPLSLNGFGLSGGTVNSTKYASCSTLQSDINSACSGLSAAPGEVILPFGSCTLTSTLLAPSYCWIHGRGIGLSTLITGNFDGINNKNGVSGDSNIFLSDFTLDASGQTSGSGRAIYLQNVNTYVVNKIRWFNPLVTGLITESGSTKGFVSDNIFDTTRGGSCVEMGNGPIAAASVVNDTHINRNSIYDCNKDGIFVLGASSVGQYGSGPFEISNNIIKRALDTGIECGVSSNGCSVKGNTVVLNASASTGITARSALNANEGNNVVIGTGTAGQIAYQIWSQNGDNTISQNSTLSDNLAYNVPIGYKTTGPAASIDSITLGNNSCVLCTTIVSNSGNETNYRQCNNADDICGSTNQVSMDSGRITATNALNFFKFQNIQGGPAGFAIRENAQSLPNGLWRFQSSGDRVLFNKNTAVAGDYSTSTTVWGATTGTNPKFTIDNGIGQVSGVTTADNFGVPAVVGTPQHAVGQTANIAATSIVASAPVGLYEAHVMCRTTTAGSGTTATFSILWTDEGGAKTFTSSTWALNSVTVTGYISAVLPIHANATTNIQYSVTGTIGTSVYACDAWATRTQ